jgi:streptomycin 6-kinase
VPVADLVIPQRLAETSVTWEGERARDWLAELPRLVAEVGERWDLDVGPPYLPGGAVSWVAPCRRRSDPARLVLKLAMPHPESAAEAAALAAWDGRGAVRLEAHDLERWALLLERCDPGTPIDDDAAGPAVGARLHEAQAPDGIPSLVDVMGRWADEVTARLDRAPALDPGVVALAIETMRTGGGTDDRVLLHGDLNPTNVLRSDRGWLAIDPKPMAGDPAYDGARLILQLAPEVGRDPVAVFGERLRAMAAALGVEPGRVGRWCVADVVVQCTFAAVTGNPDEAVRLGALLPLVVPHAG